MGEEGEGQRQVSPHVKGAGAGSYYLLDSRCPLASPGWAGSSATQHRETVLELAWEWEQTQGFTGIKHTDHTHLPIQSCNCHTHAAATMRLFAEAPLASTLCSPWAPLFQAGRDLWIGDPGMSPPNFEQLLLGCDIRTRGVPTAHLDTRDSWLCLKELASGCRLIPAQARAWQ